MTIHLSSHMHDYELHLRAVVEDLNYWRAKRFEASVFRFARIGALTLYDIMDSLSSVKTVELPDTNSIHAETDEESKIRSLEIALGDYIRGVMVIELIPVGGIVIDDLRKETGIYDHFFSIAKKYYEGSLDERVVEIGRDLVSYRRFLDAFTMALVKKGYETELGLEKKREQVKKSSPENGARIVARAWVDPTFKQKLLSNARDAVRDFGTPLSGTPNLIVVENTKKIHNVVVCTLCSCYPYDLLGNPPWWYKDDAYKKTIVMNPRETLAEMFSFNVPEEKEIRVHDSTSDYRYFVLPERPPGTENFSEENLSKLVNPESLIGTAEPLKPAVVANS